MKVLGISAHYHDSSSALVVDGCVVASAAEERFSGIKHDAGFPERAIEFCLEFAGIRASDLDGVAYYEDPHVKLTRQMASTFSGFPHTLGSFVKAARDAVSCGFWLKNDISKLLDLAHEKITFVPHHLSHAAHAFLTSGQEESAVMTIDALGEWDATSLFHARLGPRGYEITPMGSFGYPHSIGLVYSAFTAFLGFDVNDGECSTMALAAFGTPRFADDVRKVIQPLQDGGYSVDPAFFQFERPNPLPLSQKFFALFGAPRERGTRLDFSVFSGTTVTDQEQRRFADIAASVQKVTEEAILGVARRIRRVTGSSHLCYAGGVALNCVANSRILAAGIFDTVYVPPDPGDGGGAMGAALHLHSQLAGAAPRRVGPFLGESYSSRKVAELHPLLKPAEWHRYVAGRPAPTPTSALECRELGDNELIPAVARAIHDGAIVAWHQGRFENGPRALGHRSLLCRPDRVDVARRLSEKVKSRPEFRPYGCSITSEDAREVFENVYEYQLGSWMQTALKIKPEYRDRLRATCHVDGSTRPQICSAADDPRFHRLLCELKALGTLGAVLNTSLNEPGSPITSSPLDSLMLFARTDVDILVVDQLMLAKRRR